MLAITAALRRALLQLANGRKQQDLLVLCDVLGQRFPAQLALMVRCSASQLHSSTASRLLRMHCPPCRTAGRTALGASLPS